MICSMTGFGKAEHQDAEKKITVEIRSVNHRYLECNVRMPRKLNAFEAAFRNILKEYAGRGKVDVFIGYEDHREAGYALQLNEELAEQYLRCGRRLSERFGVTDDLTAGKLLTFPDVLKTEELPADGSELFRSVEAVLREAAERFRESRMAEGLTLRTDMLEKLGRLESYVDEIEAHEPAVMEAYRSQLRQKVTELLEAGQIEESRLAAEVVLYADKICTDEETVRLRSHVTQVREALEENGSVGRKLDFLAQEMNREANTILSKSGDILTADLGVALKTDIEKIREQIQNIE